jgi:hypothetical protein
MTLLSVSFKLGMNILLFEALSGNYNARVLLTFLVGGGSAGAVVANRLSRSKHNKILLLELGGDPNPIARLGISYFLLQRCPGTDLMYETVPQNNSALGLVNNVSEIYAFMSFEAFCDF